MFVGELEMTRRISLVAVCCSVAWASSRSHDSSCSVTRFSSCLSWLSSVALGVFFLVPTARRAIWAGEFTRPDDYRRDQRETPAQRRDDGARSSPGCDGCYIKGNINAEGERIYHVPDSSSYDNTVIDESKGERWFRTESEARAAGWRPPRG